MSSFNRVVLMGNVTRDLEGKDLASGMKVVDIGLAVNDRVKKGDEYVDEPTFVDVTMFGRTAEIACEYLTKGAPVLIEGRLKFETWMKDGEKRSKLKVVGEQLKLLGGKSDGGGSSERSTRTAAPKARRSETRDAPPPDEDVPF